jgi:hypothetical protein
MIPAPLMRNASVATSAFRGVRRMLARKRLSSSLQLHGEMRPHYYG